MKTKTEWKLFFITDYEKEAAYLTAMHAKGWKLTGITARMFYHFEACPKEEVVYQLDFRQQEKAAREGYLQFYADYGWEHVADCNHFSIFRKSVADGEVEIYDDNGSKLEMLKRIFYSRFLFAFAMYLFAMAGSIRLHPSFSLGVSVIMLPLLVYVAVRFYKIRQQLK